MTWKSMPSERGRLIVIEGADGTGKSTQLDLLLDRLRQSGADVVTYDFPHKAGTPIADLIGGFLNGRFGDVTPEFLALAFSLDRLNSRDKLTQDIAAGRIVVCDRYVLSNIAFQSAKLQDQLRRGALRELLLWLEYELFKLPRPDMEFVMTADEKYFSDGEHLGRNLDVKRAYIGNGADVHENARPLQVAVNECYAKLQESHQLKKISIFDEKRQRLDPDALHSLLWDYLKEAAPEICDHKWRLL